MDMRIPHLKMKMMLESDPPKSEILVWRLALCAGRRGPGRRARPGGIALPATRARALRRGAGAGSLTCAIVLMTSTSNSRILVDG